MAPDRNAETPAADRGDVLQIGTFRFELVPHHLPGVGARVFFVLDEPGVHEATNLSADEARLLGHRLILAACQAEAKEHKARRFPGKPAADPFSPAPPQVQGRSSSGRG